MTNSILCTILRSDYGDILGEWSDPVGDCSNHTSICVVWVEPWNIQLSGNSTVQICFTSLRFQNRNKVAAKNAIAVLKSNGFPHQCNCWWVNCKSRQVCRSFIGSCNEKMWQKLNQWIVTMILPCIRNALFNNSYCCTAMQEMYAVVRSCVVMSSCCKHLYIYRSMLVAVTITARDNRLPWRLHQQNCLDNTVDF